MGEFLKVKNNFAYKSGIPTRSMKEGQFEVVTQEIARVNLNILGISELKWTGMSKFNSDDHFTYY